MIYQWLVADAQPPARSLVRVREGTEGRLKNPARSTLTRSWTLRISHFPDPRPRRYARHRDPEDATSGQSHRLTK